MKNNEEKIVVEKEFCPICGSTSIKALKNKFICLNCGVKFLKPKKTKIKLRKKPRYIG